MLKRTVSHLLATLLFAFSHSNALAEPVHEAQIERDSYGVPHIFGATDADAAFGLAYAQAEDAWPIMEGSLPFYRGTAGLYEGQEGAQTDYLVKWLDLWGTLDRNYEVDLSPEIRAYVEAFAAGFNAFAADHPSEIKHPSYFRLPGKTSLQDTCSDTHYFMASMNRCWNYSGMNAPTQSAKRRTTHNRRSLSDQTPRRLHPLAPKTDLLISSSTRINH